MVGSWQCVRLRDAHTCIRVVDCCILEKRLLPSISHKKVNNKKRKIGNMLKLVNNLPIGEAGRLLGEFWTICGLRLWCDKSWIFARLPSPPSLSHNHCDHRSEDTIIHPWCQHPTMDSKRCRLPRTEDIIILFLPHRQLSYSIRSSYHTLSASNWGYFFVSGCNFGAVAN
jgi:hypothetical protein